MKKRIPALLAACIMLTGCGGDDAVQEQPSSSPDKSAEAAITQEAAPQTTEAVQESSDAPEETTEQITEPAIPTEDVSVPVEDEDETIEVIPVTDEYVELISVYDNSFLGLPQKDKVYIFQSTGATAEIEGETYHGISCYDEHEEKLYYMCDFFISEDGSKVYRYYTAEDRYSLLPETSSGFTQMDPTTQSPEEIFKVANALYGYFDLEAMNGLNDKMLEKEHNGTMEKYFMVADERLDTKAELLNALSCYFSTDIINSLMETPLYTEGPDGKLYSTGGARGADICYIDTEYELSILTADTAEFTAYSTYYTTDPYSADPLATEPLTKTITYSAVKRDGRWYFTNFELPY
ncbi:MAG: hypothetical protein E7478_09465 [Ruminococcaceae bacterium]|nr:hypothetical protein [Oscillospiraceae bacterium]